MTSSLRRSFLLLIVGLLAIGPIMDGAGQMTREISSISLTETVALAAKENENDLPEPPPRPEVVNEASAIGDGISSLPSGASVAVLPVNGIIDEYTLVNMRHRVERAVTAGAAVIVFELDTPGGRVDTALDISKYIKSLSPQLTTIAWVNNEAYSAGILIGSACNHLIMSPASATGDCLPVSSVPGHQLSPGQHEKALSAVLEEFRDSATVNQYDYALFHAMCVRGVELYIIENVAGERRLVNQVDYAMMVKGESENNVLEAIQKALGMNSKQAGAPARDAATPDSIGNWKLVEQFHDGNLLLTVNQTRAMGVGLSKGIVKDRAQLETFLGAATVMDFPQTWLQGAAYWMTRPWMRALLVMMFFIGAFIELQTPGMGIGSIMALTALIMLLVAPFLISFGQVWHLIIFAVGFILLLAEIFIIPGFGIAGISGIVCMFTGLALMMMPSGTVGAVPESELWRQLQISVLWLLFSLIGVIVAFVVMVKYFGRLSIFNRLVLQDPHQAAIAEGNVSSYEQAVKGTSAEIDEMYKSVSGDEVIGQGEIKVGDRGTVTSQLRPAGRAQIAGQTIDVISIGQWVEQGHDVKVIEIHGNEIVVESV